MTPGQHHNAYAEVLGIIFHVLQQYENEELEIYKLQRELIALFNAFVPLYWIGMAVAREDLELVVAEKTAQITEQRVRWPQLKHACSPSTPESPSSKSNGT